MTLTATELNLFGLYLVLASIVIQVTVYLRSTILLTLSPKEARTLSLVTFYGGFALYLLAVGIYLATSG